VGPTCRHQPLPVINHPERTRTMDAFLEAYVIVSRCLMASLLGSVAYVLLTLPPALNY
jgi:hypothetical protein